jgi:hypothetical protein
MSDRVRRLQARLLDVANLASDALCVPSTSGLSQAQSWLQRSWLAGLYALGLVLWAMFLDWGRIPFTAEDWVKEWVSYTILRQAVTRGPLPFHISSLIQGTDRFLAIPETLVSPQILLLRLVDIGPFILLNTLILFTVGFWGLLLLKRHLRLSPIVFTALFLLFAFNGHIMAQMAVGHAMWVGYFILPFFLLLIFQALDGIASRNWPLWMALTLFGILLQGAIHIYIWCLFFLGLLWLAAPRLRMRLFLAAGVSLLLGMFRLLPAGLAFPRGSATFYAGYSSLTQMLGGLVTLITPAQAPVMNTPVGWWEYDMYIGLLGLAFLAFFSFRSRLAWDSETASGGSSRASLWVPIAVLAVLSLGHFYYPFHSLPIPLVGHERVPSRFLILPLLTVAVLASASAQRWLDKRPTRLTERLVGLSLLVVLAQDLLQHARLWRLEVIAQSFSPIPPDLSLHIANRPDPTYLGLLGLGASVSVVTLVFTIVRLGRGRKRASPAEPSSI